MPIALRVAAAGVEMIRTAKRVRRMRAYRFTLVRDSALKKVDSNTRRHHSQ